MFELKLKENKTVYNENEKIWKGPDYIPYYNRNCSFGKIAFEEVKKRGNKICQISDTENTTLTNKEALLHAIRIARSFERLGIKQSDIIGIAGRNTTYLFPVVLACFFHGTAYHAINPEQGKESAKNLFKITKPKIIFCDAQDLEKIQYASNDFKAKVYTMKNHMKGIPSVMDLLNPTGDENEYEPAKLENGPEHTLAILCSSGSSGLPKAVTFPHCHRAVELTNCTTQDDVVIIYSTMDWFTSFYDLTTHIVYGATRIIADAPFTPEYYIHLIEKYKCTITMCSTPPMTLVSKCKEATVEKLQSIRVFYYGGARTAENVSEKIQSLIKNGRIIYMYSTTEINSILSANLNYKEKPNSVGTLQVGHQVCIVNENGERCGPNESGEIWCNRGEYWGGYYNNIEETKAAYDDKNGWFHTGDMGYFDDEGYLYIVERIKEMLKYYRIQYYPSQIEEVISKMKSVKEVCVFGIQHDEGEAAAAAVVPMEGSNLKAEDIIEFVKNNEDDFYKHLHGGCKIFKMIPKTPNMKQDRKATKALFLEMK